MASTASAAERFYIPSLDGIRAVAFLIVFLSHAGLDYVPGGFGVTVFFFLSGYLITTLLRQEFERHHAISFRKFYLRRVLRIFPPMYIALLVGSLAAVWGLTSRAFHWQAFWYQALHLTNYYQAWIAPPDVPRGLGIMWSLAVEEHFYAFFPLLYVLLLRYSSRTQATVMIGLCLLVLLWRVQLVCVYHVTEIAGTDTRIFKCTDTRIDSILFGCAMAIYHNPVLDPVISMRRRTKLLLLAVAGGLLLFSFAYRSDVFRNTLRYTLQGIALFPVFYLAVIDAESPLFRWLNYSWVAFLGRLTYSLYLFHHIFLRTLEHCWPEWYPSLTAAVIAGLLSLGVSLALYHWIEQPLARVRRKLHG